MLPLYAFGVKQTHAQSFSALHLLNINHAQNFLLCPPVMSIRANALRIPIMLGILSA